MLKPHPDSSQDPPLLSGLFLGGHRAALGDTHGGGCVGPCPCSQSPTILGGTHGEGCAGPCPCSQTPTITGEFALFSATLVNPET